MKLLIGPFDENNLFYLIDGSNKTTNFNELKKKWSYSNSKRPVIFNQLCASI